MGSPRPLDAPVTGLLTLLGGDSWSCEILTTGQVQGKSCLFSLKQHLSWGQLLSPRVTWGLRLGHHRTEPAYRNHVRVMCRAP